MTTKLSKQPGWIDNIIKMKKRDLIIFAIIFVITCVVFLPFLTGHLATDTYNVYTEGYLQYSIDHSLKDGRIIMFIFVYLAHLLSIPIKVFSSITLIIALLFSCLAIMLLKNSIEKIKKGKTLISELLLIIACYYTIFNFLYIENLYFLESAVMGISILSYILAAKSIVIEENMKKSIIFMIIGVMSYQGTVSMFVITLIVLSLLKRENYKDVIKDIFKGILVSIIGVVVNLLIIKIVTTKLNDQQVRFQISSIYNNIIIIIKSFTKVICNTGLLLPKNLFVIFLNILLLLIIIKMNKESKKVANVLIIVTIGILSAFIISLMNSGAMLSARIRYSLGALIGFLYIYIYVETDYTNIKTIIDKLLVTSLIIYAIINTTTYITVLNESKKVDKLAYAQTLEIGQYIKDYESRNGEIKNIAVVTVRNQISKAYYDGIKCRAVLTVSGLRAEWSATGCINYHLKRNLKIYNPSKDEIKEYLQKVDEDLGFLCIGDTLYISAYMY